MTDAFTAMLDEPRWLAWREELRGDKPTKVPYAASPGARGRGKSTEPRTWGTHAQAKQRAQLLQDGRATGCGIVLGDTGNELYLAGLDLDSSLNQNGVLAPWAVEILSATQSYAEVSPSGRGLKAFFYVAAEDVRTFLDAIRVKPAAWGTKRGIPGLSGANHGPGVELYCAGRYFTVTGQLWSTDHPRITVLGSSQLAELAAVIPTEAAPAGESGDGGRDSSRSARALRAARKLKAASYEAMCEGLRQHAEAGVRQWVAEKGEADNGRELRRIWALVGPRRGADGAGAAPNPPAADAETLLASLSPNFSDDSLALRFSAVHADEARFTALWGKWSWWNAKIWEFDTRLKVFNRARAVCRAASGELVLANQISRAAAVASAKTVAGVVSLARADRRHAMIPEEWDRDPWLLPEVDLRTGAARAPQRADYCTKNVAVSPNGDWPLWHAFLDRVTARDNELQAYLRRVAGYCLTGVTSEQVLFFLHGTGANGKGVFISTLIGIWGDYATVAPMETFVESPTDHHPTDIARMRGARLVVAQETEQGRRWAEMKIKALTGGDKIAARFMRQDFFEFTPLFKLMISGNHRPSLSNVEEATRRRFHLIPFTVTIPKEERDQQLAEKLKAEWPGILAWAIKGCLEWQAKGLAPPAAVLAATEAYLADEDNFTRWVEECCLTGSRLHWCSGARLWASWKAWAERGGEPAGNRKAFAQTLENHGFTRQKLAHVRGFNGITLTPPPPRADLDE